MKPASLNELPPSFQLRSGGFGKPALTLLTTLVSALGLVALGSGVVKANDLINGNLDLIAIGPQNLPTPTGWEVEVFQPIAGSNPDACSSETFCNVQEPGGRGLFFKPFKGLSSDPISVKFYQDNPSAPGAKYTFSGYAAAEANYSGLFTTNSPPPATLFVVEFLDGANTVLASNVFDLVANGLPIGNSSVMAIMTTPQYTAPEGTVTVRAGVYMLNTYHIPGSESFFVDVFDLTSVAPPGAPEITQQPVNQTVSAGSTATFTVEVSNPAGIEYQWQFYGTNISDVGGYSGTTSKTLTITGVTPAEVGHYRVRLANGVSPVFSAEGTLAIVGINFYPVVTITGKIGDTYRVDYATALAPTTWIPFSTNLLTTSPELVLDASSPGSNTRFYRAVYMP